jgi:exodeoxyribonuclease V alpha subunit
VSITKEQTKHFQLAYALSVHKAQGSQYRRVFFVCLGRDQTMLIDRSMIYTAVTRAKVECRVIGEPKAMQDAINTIRHKHTVIQEVARGTK